MSRTNVWKPIYLPITREAFDTAARKVGLRIRDRQRVFEWAKYLEQKEGVWPSAAHAIHTWITGELARQSHSRSTESHTGAKRLP